MLVKFKDRFYYALFLYIGIWKFYNWWILAKWEYLLNVAMVVALQTPLKSYLMCHGLNAEWMDSIIILIWLLQGMTSTSIVPITVSSNFHSVVFYTLWLSIGIKEPLELQRPWSLRTMWKHGDTLHRKAATAMVELHMTLALFLELSVWTNKSPLSCIILWDKKKY